MWANEILNKQNSTDIVQIPSDIKPGTYIFRTELLALHGNMGFLANPDRIVAYEEIWRREESDLWDWLEERVGLHRLNEGAMPIPKRAVEPRTFEEKIREERMNEREIEEAIRITEEKLQLLKGAHNRKKLESVHGSGRAYGRPTTGVSETER